MADYREKLFKQLAFVEGYFPDETELFQLTDTTDLNIALDKVLQTGVGFIVLKLGTKGCLVKTKSDGFYVEGRNVVPITTVGAGDCFNATFIAYYLKGKSLRVCTEMAATAASIKVSKNIWPDEAAILAQHLA